MAPVCCQIYIKLIMLVHIMQQPSQPTSGYGDAFVNSIWQVVPLTAQ